MASWLPAKSGLLQGNVTADIYVAKDNPISYQGQSINLIHFCYVTFLLHLFRLSPSKAEITFVYMATHKRHCKMPSTTWQASLKECRVPRTDHDECQRRFFDSIKYAGALLLARSKAAAVAPRMKFASKLGAGAGGRNAKLSPKRG